MNSLHSLLAHAFRDYEAWLLATNWRGKEHDCVNLFVHKFLFSHVHPAGPIADFTQVGIEVGVPQPKGVVGVKPAARKDLVIWSEPYSTTWDAAWNAVKAPLAIVEWKARKLKSPKPFLFPYDVDWLTRYSLHYPEFTGFCATVDFTSDTQRLHTASIHAGSLRNDFHRL